MSNARSALIIAALATLGTAAAAAEVYVHRGEHGELSFTDQAVPGAERVPLDPTVPPADAPEELERRIRQTLEVAEALEQSRLAREKARAEARAAARAAQPEPAPQVIYQDRYVTHPYLFAPRFDDRFHGRHDFRGRKPWEERHREQRTITKPFPYEPD
ncbi:MAG TPA: DUF4124 domain-containing protein [Pseudomonadales bacterium]